MILRDDDMLVFESTGREAYPNQGIIGISPDLEVFDGYDGHCNIDTPLTDAERNEIADYMIARWQSFKLPAVTPDRP